MIHIHTFRLATEYRVRTVNTLSKVLAKYPDWSAALVFEFPINSCLPLYALVLNGSENRETKVKLAGQL